MIAIVLTAARASAITLTLGGPSPDSASSGTDLTSTIWASGFNGAPEMIATVGGVAPGGGTFTDMGVPSISPEGMVIFGAEVTGPDGIARWEIFRGDPTAPLGERVAHAIEKSAVSPGCVPNLKLDPYPVAGSNDAIAFIAPEAAGSDALFRYADGELTCAIRTGERTASGHILKMMHFGSATMAPSGEVAFIGSIYDRGGGGAQRSSRLAMMLAPVDGPIREIAVADSRGPTGSRNLPAFGRPAVVSTSRGPIVAFTATNSHRSRARGYGLYVFRNGKTALMLASGDRTPVGRVSFLSQGRPALSGNGSIAVCGASAGHRAIFSIRDGHPVVVVTPGHATGAGSQIVTFGDPVVSATGRIMVGITDNDDRNLLYALGPENVMRISNPPVPEGELVGGLGPQIFAGTLVINEAGAFAFIGGK
jgi:hypothetical protein